MSRKLNDIVASHPLTLSPDQIVALQRRVSAASEMKSAIKKALNETIWEAAGQSPDGIRYFPVREKRLNDLRRAMEAYLNLNEEGLMPELFQQLDTPDDDANLADQRAHLRLRAAVRHLMRKQGSLINFPHWRELNDALSMVDA